MRSYRLIFATLALCLAATTAHADVTVGPLLGFSFSNLRIGNSHDLQGRSSLAAGVAVDYGINDRFGIRVEPTLLAKGTKATKRNAYWGTIDGAEFVLDYIDVPVLARYDLADTDTRGYVVAGVSTSFATTSEARLTQSPNPTETVDLKPVLKSYDVSLDIGLGVSFKVGEKNRLTIDGRSALGLVNINDGGTITFNGAPLVVPATPTHTIDFRLMVTMLFPVGGE